MLSAMKTLTRIAVLPLLAGVVALPAQSKKTKEKEREPQKIEDSKFTKKDPAIQAIDKFIKKQSISTKKRGWRLSLSKPPQQKFQEDMDYFWHMETSEGPLKIRLFTDTAPMHATSGIYLARLGFYDGLNFHRIIPGFMAQGGCPTGSGSGSPGYKYAGEFEGGRSHSKAGILSMANAGPNTDGSQFFITFAPTTGLDGRHTVWGEVVAGMKTLKGLEARGTRRNNGVIGAAGPKIVRTWVEVVPKKSDDDDKEHDKDGDGKEHKKQEKGGGK